MSIRLISAATVREQLAEHQKRLGFRYLLTLLQFGTLPADLTAASTERFAKDVMPALRELGEEGVQEEQATA